ncbi:glutamate dehydrogenase [Polaribacter sp. SA4-10]|uniref:LysE family transporter n=1 Tax=Polaribacter sp. SA4-10 TaxID=754397 RepID=UPI000B3D1586|nr:LysE family transporter [Polaribacter sp. SA4-10]ARV07002.1 glutamate dehydrogenase [Polaribacter sp. SA4-10]
MILIFHLLFGFIFSFIGSITPSMLNMTALKISLEKNETAANYYNLGVSLIVFIQTYIAVILTNYISKNPSFLESLEKAGIFIFILLSFYFYRQSKKEKTQVKASNTKKGSSFLSGIILSFLNMFAIPFFCGIVATLALFNLFNFDIFPVLFFVFGAGIGSFFILFLYAKYAKQIQKKAGKITKDINLVLSVLTGLFAVLTLFKLFVLND